MATGSGAGGAMRGYTNNTGYNPVQDTGTVVMAVRKDNPVPLAISDGKYAPLQTDPSGALNVTLTGKKPDGTYSGQPIQGTVAHTNTVLGGTTLASTFVSGATTMTVESTRDFASSGRLWIQSEDHLTMEEISYTGKTPTAFTGCVRARSGTMDQTHAAGSCIGEMYVSSIIDIDQHAQFQFELFSSGDAKLVGTWYMDDADQDTSKVIGAFFIAYTSRVLENSTSPRLSRYVRVAWAPTDGETQTSTMMRFNLLTSPVSGHTVPANGFVSDNMIANLGRSITLGRQPDGDYVNAPADGAAWTTSSTLSAGATYLSEWTDTDGWNSIEIFITSDVMSAFKGIELQYTCDTQEEVPIVRASRWFTFNSYDVHQGFKKINVDPVLDGYRIRYTNGGLDQSMFYMATTLKTNQANERYNPGQAIMVGEFETEVALGAVDGYKYVYISGRNPIVDAGETGDLWDNATNGGGPFNREVGNLVYAGQPLNDPEETVKVVSSSAQDTAAGTGARTVRITGLHSITSEKYETEVIVMNGTTASESSSRWYRIIKLEVLTAGNRGENVGRIKVYNSTTTNNLFIDMASGQNETQNAVYTVPANRQLLIKRFKASVVRANGGSGSAYMRLLVRDTFTNGAVYRPICTTDVQTGSRFYDDFRGGILVDAGSDIKVEITNVSDNGTSAQGIIEAILIDT